MSTPLLPRIAIIGAGPSGFYAAEALQKAHPGIAIDLFDRLPTPFGLVRGGVAPDHPKIKSVTKVFERIASQPGFRFLGHVEVGSDVSVAELREHYDAVIATFGARTDRPLGIPGEHLAGSHAATELVGWYNGHPDYADLPFDLDQSAVAIIGIGNVAMDVARILAKSPDALATTDLAAHALTALRSSAIRTIHVIARRGAAQAACTTPELRELGELEGVDVVVPREYLDLDEASATLLAHAEDRTAEKNLAVLREWADRAPTGAPRQIHFHFVTSPVALLGEDRIEALVVERNRLEADGQGGVRAVPTGEQRTLPIGLVFRSVGYRGVALEGLPFDVRRGTIPNQGGRVTVAPGSSETIPGLYVAGWIKRGPQGVIGTNKSCAAETVALLVADLETGAVVRRGGKAEAVDALLAGRGVRVTTWSDWQRLDAEEQARGAPAGRPREKIVAVEEMLAVIGV
jgi:ferredoxin--NADP+ reductase